MTGRHCLRAGSPLLVGPSSRNGMPLEEVTIADQLKQTGYATACIGKWHLGHVNGYAPLQRGFDCYYGIPWSNDQGKPLYRDDTEMESSTDLLTITQRYTREALTFIEENRSRPFFLYLPHTMPHTPLAASKNFPGTSERGLYGNIIEEIDWNTGEILSKIRGLGLEQDTFVIFTSDNGPWLSKGEDGGSADPLRGGKWSSWEGGQREPCVMWWPGTNPAGTECREIASMLDLLPTRSDLAGVPFPDCLLDGRSIASLMTSPETTTTPAPHQAFLYYGRSQNDLQCIRQGKWEAISGGSLYNLEEDISESTSVARDHPDIVKDLRELMTGMHEKVINDEPYEDTTPVIGRRGSALTGGRISHNRGGLVDARGRSLKLHQNRPASSGATRGLPGSVDKKPPSLYLVL